jgi:hypothetical protein
MWGTVSNGDLMLLETLLKASRSASVSMPDELGDCSARKQQARVFSFTHGIDGHRRCQPRKVTVETWTKAIENAAANVTGKP